MEMELWVKLAELAIKQKDYNLVCTSIQCIWAYCMILYCINSQHWMILGCLYMQVCQCTANAITLKRHRLSHDDIGTLAKEKYVITCLLHKFIVHLFGIYMCCGVIL